MGRKKLTHCKYGHEYNEQNTYISPKGIRLCRECSKRNDKKSRLKNPEKRMLASRNWEKRNRDKISLKWEIRKLKQYGLTIEHYNKLLLQQNNKCAICEQNCPTGKKLAVDHNHTTGQIRGLLCMECNTGIGKLKDNPILIAKALNYLLKQ